MYHLSWKSGIFGLLLVEKAIFFSFFFRKTSSKIKNPMEMRFFNHQKPTNGRLFRQEVHSIRSEILLAFQRAQSDPIKLAQTPLAAFFVIFCKNAKKKRARNKKQALFVRVRHRQIALFGKIGIVESPQFSAFNDMYHFETKFGVLVFSLF